MITTDDNRQRNSVPDSADLITDPQELAEKEAANGLFQFDIGTKTIEEALDPERPSFKLRVSKVLQLHRAALEGISAYAGNFRPAGVGIEGSRHEPPGAHLVPELLEELCDYVNENWDQTAIHLASYVMWRLNWIHPFADGNGRTSRILSYVVLCIRIGKLLPGTPTIPEQIAGDRKPYFDALDAADEAFAEGRIDVGAMEELMTLLLARQLMGVITDASGKSLAEIDVDLSPAQP